MPDNANENLSCIVMAHGFAATHAGGLSPFKEAFCKAGHVVLAFDYRGFGDSGGEPRQILDPWKEVDDYLAALSFVRQLKGIDANRICLWGTSFSGGLVTVAAARDQNVRCIIAQCPMMDGLSSFLEVHRYGGIRQGIRLTYHAIIDFLRRAVGMSPHCISAAGRPGTAAIMTAEDCWDGYARILAKNAPNKVAAGIAMLLPFFRPIRYADKVKCPALVLICTKDTVAPARAAEKAAAYMSKSEVKRYAVGHFDVYVGEALVHSINDQIEFLDKIL
jgi:pimeloyl-ACP methyl ester carboxylesterase